MGEAMPADMTENGTEIHAIFCMRLADYAAVVSDSVSAVCFAIYFSLTVRDF